MTVLVLGVLGGALLLLPGFAIRSVARRPQASALDELGLGVGVSIIAIAVAGSFLVGIREFTATRMAVVFTLIALGGIPRAVRWAWPLVRRPEPYLMLVLTVPWWWSAQRPGNPPAGLLHWYYWNLATSLTRAQGIPSHVTEYGREIRWLPDYLIFNLVSETYHGMARVGIEAQALAAFRIPVALLGIVAVFAVARLWLRRAPALVATALVVATQLFGDKFNAYKPEPLAIALGLIAVRLAIVGMRRRDTHWMLFAGVLIGLNLGVHAIAAVVMGMLLAGAVVAELVVGRELRRWATISALALTGIVALGVAAGTGYALQGRALVISDAAQPERRADGEDPTLLFLTRNAGRFDAPEERSLGDELSSNLQEPWRGFDLTSAGGVLLGLAVIAGIALGVASRNRNLRKAVVAMVAFAAMLTVGAAYFGIRYDTFVPRHTGLFRFVQYAPLLAGMLVAIAVEGFSLKIEALGGAARARAARIAAAVAVIAGTVAVGIHETVDRYRNFQSVPPATIALLNTLEESSRPGDAVLSNVGTRGTFEFWTGMENPLEGRQVLIEAPEFVDHSTAVIEDAHRFFTGTGAADLADRLGVNWIVVADQPTLLGGSASWGRPGAGWTVPGFETVRRDQDGLLVLHRPTVDPRRDYEGPARDRGLETVTVLLVMGAAGGITWWVLRRREPDGAAPVVGLSSAGDPLEPAGTRPPATGPASSTGRPGGSGRG